MNKKIISLSFLVEEVISEFINGTPELRASFAIENNVIVCGDYQLWRADFKSLIEHTIDISIHAQLPVVLFGTTEQERVCVVIDDGQQFNFPVQNTLLTVWLHEEVSPDTAGCKRIVVNYGVKILKPEDHDLGHIFHFCFN